LSHFTVILLELSDLSSFTAFTDLNLVGILTDMSLAGSDTSANTANFAIRYLVQNPKVQTRMQQEIDQVLGNDRWFTLEDKPK